MVKTKKQITQDGCTASRGRSRGVVLQPQMHTSALTNLCHRLTEEFTLGIMSLNQAQGAVYDELLVGFIGTALSVPWR